MHWKEGGTGPKADIGSFGPRIPGLYIPKWGGVGALGGFLGGGTWTQDRITPYEVRGLGQGSFAQV